MVAATPNLEVQMRSRGIPRLSAEPERLIARDALALDYEDLGKVRVDGEDRISVIDPDNESVVGHRAGESYRSTRPGVHGCAGGDDDVDAPMDGRAIGPPS